MSIRTKLGLALALAATAPLLIIALLGQWSLRGLGHRMAGEQRELLIARAEDSIRQLAEQSMARFSREATIFSGALQAQTQMMELLMRRPAPEPTAIFTPQDFRAQTVPGLEPNDRYRSPDGRSIPVSFSAPVMLARGEHAQRDVPRLAELTISWTGMSEITRDALLWQFIAMHDGTIAMYPGAAVPEDFDPLALPPIQRVVGYGERGGINAFSDPITGQIVIGIAEPVRNALGEPMGTSVVLMTISRWSEQFNAPATAGSKAYMVYRVPGGDWGGRLMIIAQRGYERREVDPGQSLGFEFFQADLPEDTEHVGRIIQQGGAMVTRRLRHQGEPALAVIAPADPSLSTVNRDLALIVLVPERDVTALADRSASWIMAETRKRLWTDLGLLVVVLAAGLGLVGIGARRITRPIETLAQAAGKLAQGDITARADVRTGDELQSLADTFNSVGPRLADQLRLRDAMSLATEVQRHLLPQQFPGIAGLDVAGRSIPCDEVGGDYFDFLIIERSDGEHAAPQAERAHDRLGIAVGDVTGHGIAAALLMTSARSALRARNRDRRSLGQRMTDLNEQLTLDTTQGRFMTMCWLEISRDRSSLAWANAGHDPPLLFDEATGEVRDLHGGGIPLGIERGQRYDELALSAGERGWTIVLGTDGIWEARNGRGEMFGKSRLVETVRAHLGRSASEVVEAIVEAVRSFRGDQPQHDDVTLVVVRTPTT